MADEENGINDTGAAILAELLQVEISVHSVIIGVEQMQVHPAAVLLRNEIGILLGIAQKGATSIVALRDLVWAQFGVGGVSGE